MRIKERAVAAVGLVLITGGILGVTASAASAAPASDSAQSAENGRRDHDRGRDDDRRGDRRDRTFTVGRFESRQACKWYGRIGDRNGWWEDPRCVRVGRSTWILRVEPDHDRNRRR